jgi:quercetin dioxygenase-like cupin family protein
LVYAGEGLCHTGAQTTPMRPGDMWFIPAGLEHWFETDEATLRVIAFHPDSEFGPTDESHQMLNATVTTAAAA